VFRTIRQQINASPTRRSWEGPGFSRAVTIPMNAGLQPLRNPVLLRTRHLGFGGVTPQFDDDHIHCSVAGIFR
jgi:hypothetical protein